MSDLSGAQTVSVERLYAPAAAAAQARAAGALEAAGLAVGDRVVFCLGSSAALLCAVLGALRRGIVPVLLNATLLDAERDLLVKDADAKLVILDNASLGALDEGPEVPLALYPLARPMHYTSGTTGRPKGVWTGVLGEDDAEALFEEEAELWGFGPDDVHLVCSPMYHSVSIRFAGATLLRGGSVVVPSRFDAATAARAVVAERVTTTFAAPTSLARLLDACGPGDLEHLRLLVHAGAPCPVPLKQRALAATAPGALWEFYGSTEGQFTVCPPEYWQERPGTVGRARPGRALWADDRSVLWCRAPSHARFEYFRDSAATAEAWRGDAFSVGDLGRVESDGSVFLDGRRDDLIITGGVNVYPAEVEAALARLEGVRDVAVYGVDDDEWGQHVCAAVVGEVHEPQLRAFAAEHLAPYKRPKEYLLVEELPRTATGKLLRRVLRGQEVPR
ncbi:MAG: class I adenylate-forming enzyme family protein [Acidimicrobiales bacterium]